NLLDNHDQNLRLALASYNAGTGRVRGWLGDPQFSTDGATLDHIPFEETRTYIRRVLFNERVYTVLYGGRNVFLTIMTGIQR
ncbi:MAG: hypothetical protein FWD98_03205, partial [Defluviitaleaceae bacterium]|nr:hypothetical protein [Defluviitaleaceae bacterium]